MLSEHVFFTFVRLTDPGVDDAYNAWHFLDHRPENLAQPGVAWGDRWKIDSACREHAAEPDPMLKGTDYVAQYWFRPPYEESIAAWNNLAEDSHRWGRGPQFPGLERPLRGFYRPVQGYAAPRILVDADVLPFRPNRGLNVTVRRYRNPFSAQAHAQYTWYDRDRLPALLEVPGVAGAWTFSLYEQVRRPWDRDTRELGKDDLRLTLLYFDADPVETTLAVRAREAELDAAGRGAPAPDEEEVLVSYPVRSISPWSG